MRIIQIVATISIIIFATILGGAFFVAQHPWVDFSVLSHYQAGKPTLLLDDEGNEWARFQLDRREPIHINEVPQHVVDAFLAAEDHNFYEHAGISWRGIIRSTLTNIFQGRKAQGASTITQQLIKLLFYDMKKTFSRKIKEQLLAMIAEQQFTKDQILETYLNHIYFGSGIYGVEAAAQRFWNKSVKQLTIEEGATLAGIIRAPNRYCPLENLEAAYKRRNVVLACMLNTKCIDQQSYDAARAQPLILTHSTTTCVAPHLREMIRIYLEELVGKHALYNDGLIIQTTLNQAMQKTATRELQAHINTVRKQGISDAQGAVVSIEGATGAIKALVGGYDFSSSQFNRATQAKRQVGSIFKPFLFAAALEQGIPLTQVYVDEPLSFVTHNNVWQPRNSHKRFDGPMSLAFALVRSNNIIPIKLLLELGIENIIQRSYDCHLGSNVLPYPSLALGCLDATPLEVVAAFNIFPQKGIYRPAYFIAWIKDAQGKKIAKHLAKDEQVMAWRISSQITKVLTSSVQYWKNILKFSPPDCHIMGKTGTTNDARTCWFVGATPSYTTAVYIGCDDNRLMGNSVYAMRTALPVFMNFNRKIVQPQKQFAYDPRLSEININAITGKQTNPYDPQAIALFFDSSAKLPTYRPTESAAWQEHVGVPPATDAAEEPQQPLHSEVDDQLTQPQEV